MDFDESVSFGGMEAAAALDPPSVPTLESEAVVVAGSKSAESLPAESSLLEASALSEPALVEPAAIAPISIPTPTPAATEIQASSATLKHVQTQTIITIPSQLSAVRIGKPNDHTPPDIDVSGFPESEIVSRVHANLLVEKDAYYLEDMGSSNGTYINGLPLPTGNRHRLNLGDRIAFGKGDKVSFIFEATRY
jgi:hypothetical protein